MKVLDCPLEVDGKRFVGTWVFDEQEGRRPGILIAHEGAGLTDVIRDHARRIAGQGYVTLAVDLFGLVPYRLEEAKKIVTELRADREALRRRMLSWLATLQNHPGVDPGRLGAVGYCFGGTAILELARGGAPLKAVAGFHAGLDAKSVLRPGVFNGKILICTGYADPIITAAQREAFAAEMSEAGADWQLHLYGGVAHSFTNPTIDAMGFAGFSYHSLADARASTTLGNFLSETLAC